MEKYERLDKEEMQKYKDMTRNCIICHKRFFYNTENNLFVCYLCGDDHVKKENSL